MFNIDVEEIQWGGKTLRLETGRMARQADGAVLATYGETTVLATAVAARAEKPGIDFFPLTVDYEERMYAIGKIPGSFFRREGRPGTDATLTARMTDRPIRPLFPKGFKREVEIAALQKIQPAFLRTDFLQPTLQGAGVEGRVADRLQRAGNA